MRRPHGSANGYLQDEDVEDPFQNPTDLAKVHLPTVLARLSTQKRLT